ncbi:MAG: thioredoxin family protein [Gammaproteobacteria bacterium]|nr:thioredoxin family protein [Gammaproteobacteria bacterium]
MQILYKLLLVILTWSSCTSGYAATEYIYEYDDEPFDKAPVPALTSFSEVAESARKQGVPILVEFSTPWYRYCEALEQQVLKPLILSEQYDERIIIKKLEINTYSSITGFDGKRYRSDEISRSYAVDLYPTLVFFDANGREISRRIVGITVLDYVAEELEQAINVAIKEAATTR